MARRERAVEVGADRAREILGQVATEIRSTRLNNGLSQQDVGAAMGISRSQYSRIERGLSPRLSIYDIVRWMHAGRSSRATRTPRGREAPGTLAPASARGA